MEEYRAYIIDIHETEGVWVHIHLDNTSSYRKAFKYIKMATKKEVVLFVRKKST
jgi:hypothetical protein